MAHLNPNTYADAKHAAIACGSSGDNTIVAAVAGKRIRILSIFLVATDAVTVFLKSNATALIGSNTIRVPLDETGATGPAGFRDGDPIHGIGTGEVGKPITLNLSAAENVVGRITYIEVD